MAHFEQGVRAYRRAGKNLSRRDGGWTHLNPPLWSAGGASVRLLNESGTVEETKAPVLFLPSLWWRGDVPGVEAPDGLLAGLAEAGHPVFGFGWASGADEDMALTPESFLRERLRPAVKSVRSATSSPVILSHGFGGHWALALAALDSDAPAGVILAGCPWDLQGAHPLMAALGPACIPAVARITEATGYLPGSLALVLLTLLDPFSTRERLRTLAHTLSAGEGGTAAAEDIIRRQIWADHANDLPASLALPLLRAWFLENSPAKGNWTIGNQAVSPSTDSGPALLLTGRRDTFAPAKATSSLRDTLRADELEVPGDHLDLLMDKGSQNEIPRRISRWIIDNLT